MTHHKPTNPEGEYFARVEAEKLRQVADEKQKALTEEQIKRLKELHWMRCPKCGMELHSVPYKGVIIDKCFSCNGVYLDDGELEKVEGGESGFLKGFFSLFKQS